MSKEPSMEEILSSIKRIIAEEGDEAVRTASRPLRRSQPLAAEPEQDESFDAVEGILELTDLAEPVPAQQEEEIMAAPRARSVTAPAEPVEDDSILSVESEVAARHSLSALSSMVVRGDGADNTLEGLVRAMLKPMLKDWLDANLPELVEGMVAREIARITGRSL
jgi:cell pole-organizing protein PopZ